MTSLAKIDATAAKAANDADMHGETGNITQTCPAVKLEIGVFFDGTLNNRYNVISKKRSDDSYKNALSNPALLWARYKDGPAYNEKNKCGGIARTFRRIYVEGPGSTKGEADDWTGYITGMGSNSGVEARVLKAFRDVVKQVNMLGGASKISKLVLDVFGFSRGAAGARYFVNCIRARKILYLEKYIKSHTAALPDGLKVEIRFLGIFDTVAAIGKADDDDNGAVNVHLKTAQVTTWIYHLTAGEEYRRNFRLNENVPGGGYTLEFPGAHSDVGGGYRDPGDITPISEKLRTFPSRKQAEQARAQAIQLDRRAGAHADIAAQYVKEGWMDTDDTEGGVTLETSKVYMISGITYGYTEKYILNRPWVKIGLSRVALHKMHEIAKARVNGAFLDLPTTDANYVIPKGLRPYVSEIKNGSLSGLRRRYVLRNYGHVSMKGSITGRVGHGPDKNHKRVPYPNKTSKAI